MNKVALLITMLFMPQALMASGWQAIVKEKMNTSKSDSGSSFALDGDYAALLKSNAPSPSAGSLYSSFLTEGTYITACNGNIENTWKIATGGECETASTGERGKHCYKHLYMIVPCESSLGSLSPEAIESYTRTFQTFIDKKRWRGQEKFKSYQKLAFTKAIQIWEAYQKIRVAQEIDSYKSKAKASFSGQKEGLENLSDAIDRKSRFLAASDRHYAGIKDFGNSFKALNSKYNELRDFLNNRNEPHNLIGLGTRIKEALKTTDLSQESIAEASMLKFSIYKNLRKVFERIDELEMIRSKADMELKGIREAFIRETQNISEFHVKRDELLSNSDSYLWQLQTLASTLSSFRKGVSDQADSLYTKTHARIAMENAIFIQKELGKTRDEAAKALTKSGLLDRITDETKIVLAGPKSSSFHNMVYLSDYLKQLKEVESLQNICDPLRGKDWAANVCELLDKRVTTARNSFKSFSTSILDQNLMLMGILGKAQIPNEWADFERERESLSLWEKVEAHDQMLQLIERRNANASDN